MKNHFCFRVFALLLVAALTASLAVPVAAEGEAPTDFSVLLAETQQMTAGTVQPLSADIVPAPPGTQIAMSDVTWDWSCDRPELLRIETGEDDRTVSMQALDFGIAEVTATASVRLGSGTVRHASTCRVTVLPAAADRITVTPASVQLDENETQELTASVSEFADPEDVTWEADKDAVVRVSQERGRRTTITGRAPGTATVTASSGNKRAVCSVEVRGIALSKSRLTLAVGDSDTLGATPYGGIGTRVEWESGNDTVAFVTAGGKITAQSAGSTRVTATIGGYSAVCEVTVRENTADTITDSVGSGRAFSLEEIRGDLNNRCRDRLQETLSYVTNLSVPTDQGILYYGYVSQDDPGHAVGSSERYYYSTSAGERSLAAVFFVPNSGFTGTAIIQYAGFGSGSKFFTGTIELEVEGGSEVAYSTTSGTPVTFLASDFSAVCRARTGREMSTVTFDQPSASRGTLYYDYSTAGQYAEKVSGGTQYGRTRSPYLDRVSFVPSEDYAGTFRIPYRCVDTAGSAYSGQVSITVTSGGGTGGGEVNYSVDQGGSVTFRASDFNSACRAANGEPLDYIRFELPSASRGTLYYNYRGSGSSGSKVASSTRYYRSGSPSISDVTFVSNRSYEGTVDIDFSGYDEKGERFSGQVSIRVSEDGWGDGMVRYTVDQDGDVTFQASDFNDACLDVSGVRLSSIRFMDLPASSQGTLYYNYRSSGSYDSKVSTATRYYRSGTPSISNITFVPKSTYRGTVSFDFKGYDADGGDFNGTVRVDVGEAGDRVVRYSAVSGRALSFDADDFNDVCKDETSSALSYVQFTPPSSSRGLLVYRYDEDKETYSSKVTSSTNYYRTGGSRSLNDVSFLPDKGYTGPVEVRFTGWSMSGKKFTGTVEIEVAAQAAANIRYTGSAAPIPLRASDFRAACSALQGRELSYIQFTSLPGTAAGRLYAGVSGAGSRGTPANTGVRYDSSGSPGLDQLSFVAKAGFQGKAVLQYYGMDTKGKRFDGVVEITVADAYCITPFTDMGSYAWAKPAAEFLRQRGVVNGYTPTQFGPARNITRGDFVLMLCRAFGFRTESAFSFPDVAPGSYYGWAVATAKDLGIVQGSNGRFLPGNPLNRQEAMVMIRRAMDAAGIYVPAGGTSALSAYKDAGQVSDYAREAVASMVQMGVVYGTSGGEIKPRSAISRAEMAVILHRVLTL